MLKFHGLERQAAVLLRIAKSEDSMSASGFSESLQRNLRLLVVFLLLLVQTLPDWRLLEGFYFGAIPTHQIFLELGSFLSWDCASFKMLPAKQTRWCLRAPTHPTCSLDKFLKRSFRHEVALSPTHHHRIQLATINSKNDCSWLLHGVPFAATLNIVVASLLPPGELVCPPEVFSSSLHFLHAFVYHLDCRWRRGCRGITGELQGILFFLHVM